VTTVAGLLRWRAIRHPDLAAISYEGRRTSYAELDRSSSRLAAGLAEKIGVRPGDRVAILDRNSDRYLALIFAIAKAGAVTVPVNWRLRAPEVAQVVGDARPAALVAGEEFAGSTSGAGCRVLGFDELPEGDHDPQSEVEDAVAWQLYTSGTTGLPKGALLTDRNLFAMVLSLGLEMPEIVEGSASLALSPLYHIGGSGWALLALAHGATCVLVREVVPERLAETLVQERVATGLIVPAVLQSLTNLDGIAGREFGSLRNVAYGASPISPTLLERVIAVFRTRVTQLYGLTETTGAVTALRHEDHTGDRLLSCGRAMLGGEVRAVDGEDRPLPPGEVGEIVYRGASLMGGYWNRPEDTATVVRGGWFHTGDAGTLDADGFLFIRDRIKDVIVSGGENVYPAELESALSAHPEVLDVAVIGIPDQRWGETVKALVVRRPGSGLGEPELVEWCRPRLAGYKRPRSVDFVDAIPRNPSGKILKHELRERYWTGETRRVH
jgi:long-chain acyl-CoA synthetase